MLKLLGVRLVNGMTVVIAADEAGVLDSMFIVTADESRDCVSNVCDTLGVVSIGSGPGTVPVRDRQTTSESC